VHPVVDAHPGTTAHPLANVRPGTPAQLGVTTRLGIAMRWRGVWLSVGTVAAAVVVGGITSFGQLLPGTFNWFANSVAGWTIPMVALVWCARGTVIRSAITGGLAFVAMSVGYALVSTLRGYPDTPWLWATIGIVVGPVLGAATALLRSKSTPTVAISGGILGGIVVGDGVRGLFLVPDGWGTWTVIVVAGVTFLMWLAATKLRAARPIALQLVVAAFVAGCYVFTFDVILGGISI
jgi:hypothetical protein